MRLPFAFFCSTLLLFSDNLSSSLSSQGFTGLINTPNAQVIQEGNAVFQFNNQFDNNLRYYDYGKSYNSEENYIAGIGFYSNFEVITRLVESIGYARDLSGSIKYQIPYQNTYLPTLAIGAQDIGGAASYFTNYYAVLDKEIGIFRPSFGYGKSADSLIKDKRMDGLFGGVEAKVTDWMSVMAEHDGKENHTAVRLRVPNEWLSAVNLEATVAQNLTQSQTSFAVNVAIPLFHDSQKNLVLLNEQKNNIPTVTTTTNTQINTLSSKEVYQPKVESTVSNHGLETIQKQLVAIGFENVQVGIYDKSIYIKAENSVFDHNDLDALGVIMGSIVNNSEGYSHYIVTLLKNNLQTLTISGNVDICQNYLETPTIEHQQALKSNLQFSRTFNEMNVKFLSKKQNSSFLVPRLELSPGLTTTIGTEVGAFDYLLALRANAYTTLYDGLTLSAMYEMPLTHSQNFDEGYVYGVMYQDKLKNRLVNTMLHQTVHYESLLNTTSIGQFQADYYGVLNHSNFTTTSGEHGFNLKLGTFSHRTDDTAPNRNIYLGSYRYFYAPLDLFTEVMYGQFWDQDKGAMLQLKRFFGETSVALYLKDSVKTYAGFEVSVPLTFRKLSKASPLGQVKGKSDFSYGIRTVVKSPDNRNYLNPTSAIIPKTDLELSSVYLNRDRLSASYVQEHLDRLREAYLYYGQK